MWESLTRLSRNSNLVICSMRWPDRIFPDAYASVSQIINQFTVTVAPSSLLSHVMTLTVVFLILLLRDYCALELEKPNGKATLATLLSRSPQFESGLRELQQSAL